MDVQVPSTGRRFYKIDDAIGMILCDAGICIPLHAATKDNPPNQLPPAKDEFSVAIVGTGRPVIQLRRPSGEVVRYGEHPSGATAAFAAIKATLPKEILEQYAQSFPQDAEYVAEMKRQQITQAQAAQRAQSEGKSQW